MSATSASRRSRSATRMRSATCDNHSIYKNGAKEIADQHGKALTFMAKFNEREGNSCHIHLSFRSEQGRAGARGRRRVRLLEDDGALHRGPARDDARAHPVPRARTSTRTSATSRAASRRPRSPGVSTTAPARCGSSARARACASRTACPAATSTSTSRSRRSSRAACTASRTSCELEPIFEGNAYGSDAPRVPSTLRDAAELFAASDVAKEAFGENVVAPLPQQRAHRAARVRRRHHRLGAGSGLRALLMTDTAVDRPHHLPGAGADRRLGRPGVLPAEGLLRRRERRGRHRHPAAAAARRRRRSRTACSTVSTA